MAHPGPPGPTRSTRSGWPGPPGPPGPPRSPGQPGQVGLARYSETHVCDKPLVIDGCICAICTIWCSITHRYEKCAYEAATDQSEPRT
jgi:hypothetical protein